MVKRCNNYCLCPSNNKVCAAGYNQLPILQFPLKGEYISTMEEPYTSHKERDFLVAYVEDD